MKKSNTLFVLSTLFLFACSTPAAESSAIPSSTISSTSYSDRYEEGYNEGYSSGKEDGYSEGYSQGKEDGASEAHSSDAYSSGVADGYSIGYDSGFDSGKEEGYEEGFEAGKENNIPVYSIHSPIQDAYLKGSPNSLPSGIDGLKENSLPNPITINVADEEKYGGAKPSSYTLILATTPDFADAVEYETIGSSSIFELYNLNIGQRYYYKHKVQIKDETRMIDDVKSFYVDGQAPRNIYLDGVTNCRDVGGWAIEGTSARTKQNLMYRTGRMHDDVKTYITQKGMEEYRRLGIKSEIDLRDEGNDTFYSHASVIPDVDYYYCPVNSGESYISSPKNRESWKKAFKVVADTHNYPLSFHCAIGTDRTGFFAYILNSLVGVSLDDLKRDYVFSCFGAINGLRDAETITNYAKQIDAAYNGQGDRSVGSNNFLLSLGLTQGEINNIKEILTGVKYTHEHTPSGVWTPSEVDNSYHVQLCSDPDCGVVLEKEKHVFGELIIDKEPTAIEDGIGHYTCPICGYEESIVIKHSSKDFDVLKMKDYGGGKSFSVYLDCDEVQSLDLNKCDFKLTRNDEPVEGAIVTLTPGESASSHPLLNITLPTTPNKGDVITLSKHSVLVSNEENYVLTRDAPFTYDGSMYAPSFYLGSINSRKGKDGMELELMADFTDFTDGQAADGLQPYYTSTDKGKQSHFTYTLAHGGTTYTVVNDNYGQSGTLTTKTQMYWVAAHILRVTVPFSYLSDGDVFTIKKGTVYADNGGHTGHVNNVKRYILEKDVSVSFNANTNKFELV